LFLIKGENEAMMDGKEIHALFTDLHKEHINGHKAVLGDPSLREDQGLIARVSTHLQEHFDLLQTTDPAKLQLMGQQPLPPPMPPGAPQGEQGAPPPGSEGVLEPPPQGIQGLQDQNAQISGPGLEQPVNLPNMPQVPPEALANPALQENAMGNVKQG
jgi:hypothetical protein